MRKVRLIDANALIDNTDDRYSFGEIGRREMDDIVNAIEYNAPTIEAIPVEWLVNLYNEYAREGREQAEGDLMNLLMMWQKEQEASE